ncbi:MAG: EAL domain-containing protein [Spirochaetes bacterium]|nr:EAL domain-containing protein [Spirochaetota bacterium]
MTELAQKKINVLLVEDLTYDAQLEKTILEKSNLRCDIVWVSNKDEFYTACKEFVPDVVVSDYHLPDITAEEIVEYINTNCKYVPVIIISGAIGEETTVEIIKNGAVDVLLKQHLFKLPQVIERAIAETQKKKDLDEALEKLTKTKELQELILQNVPVGIIVVKKDGEIVEINNHALMLLGYNQDTRPQHFSAKSFFVEASQCTHFFKVLNAKKIIQNYEAKVCRKDGAIRIFSFCAVMHTIDQKQYIFTAIIDVTEQRVLEDRVLFLSFFDPLTQLPNRALLKDRIDLALMRARHNKRYVAVITLDVDRFKYVNDSLGHKIGDDILLEISQKLSKTLRDGDVVARIGNDEFGIMLIDIARNEDIISVINKIRNIFTQPFHVGTNELLITASMGVALFPNDGGSAEELLQNADIALAKAREQGRFTCQFYTKDLNRKVSDYISLEAKLKRAIAQNEFELYYQPYFNIRTKKIAGMEALLRWNSDGKVISPATFIPVLEDSGLIIDAGRWIIEDVCRQLLQWKKTGLQVKPVSLNVSPIQFQKPDFKDMVIDTIPSFSMDTGYIVLEITESTYMRNIEYTKHVMQVLKDRGLHFAIDDFGTGYSSLSSLLALSFDYLKIDRSFIVNVDNDPNSSILIRAINTMAHTIGIRTIAEGVETESQLQLLADLRCDFAQGFYFSKPLKVDKLIELLK